MLVRTSSCANYFVREDPEIAIPVSIENNPVAIDYWLPACIAIKSKNNEQLKKMRARAILFYLGYFSLKFEISANNSSGYDLDATRYTVQHTGGVNRLKKRTVFHARVCDGRFQRWRIIA